MKLSKTFLYNKLVTKVNNIDTSGFVLKIKCDADKSYLAKKKKIINANKKVLDTSGLVKKTDYNAKITEIKDKIPSISSLSTTTALTEIKN